MRCRCAFSTGATVCTRSSGTWSSQPEFRARCQVRFFLRVTAQMAGGPELDAGAGFLHARTGLPTIAVLSVDKPYRDLPTLRMDKSEAL